MPLTILAANVEATTVVLHGDDCAGFKTSPKVDDASARTDARERA